MKKTLEFFFHPAALALVISFTIILFLPPVFNKYQAEIIESNTIRQPDVYSYYDLNSDGISEEIWYFGPPKKYPTIIVKNKGKILDQ